MKFLCLCGTLACMLMALYANSQSSALPLNQHPLEKAQLFNLLPEKISCEASSLKNIFTAGLNNNINVSLGQLKIEGVVIAKCAVTPEQLSINIRCSNFQNAMLNISRLIQSDGSVKYAGRIVSLNHGDVLLLWEENGQYSFIRQKQLLAMVE